MDSEERLAVSRSVCLGLAVGDSLGATSEFIPPKRIKERALLPWIDELVPGLSYLIHLLYSTLLYSTLLYSTLLYLLYLLYSTLSTLFYDRWLNELGGLVNWWIDELAPGGLMNWFPGAPTDDIYSTLLYSTLLYSTLLYSTLLYSTLLYSTLLYLLYLLYSTLFYSVLLCSTTGGLMNCLFYDRWVDELSTLL
eukprot:g55334.t1